MKLDALIKKLNEIRETHDNCEVILQKDGEGNGYSPLENADGEAVYVAETGTVYSTDWSAEDAFMDWEDWEELLKKPKCVVLFPVG